MIKITLLALVFLGLLLLISSCNFRSEGSAKYKKIDAISRRAEKRVLYDPLSELAYTRKVKNLEQKVELKCNKSLSQMKLELILVGLKGVQNTVGAVGVPVISKSVCMAIDRTISSYYYLEKLNNMLERTTGMEIEVDDTEARLEFSNPF